VKQIIGEGQDVTYDLGGSSGTRDMGHAIAVRTASLIGA
jgi:hypothetical protein